MATAFHKVTNNAAGTLASSITDTGTSIAVNTGEGAEFSASKQYLTIGRADGYTGEIIDVVSRSSDTFTATGGRGSQSTAASAHAAGDAVECLLTAAHMTEVQDAVNGIENGTTTLAQVKLGDDTGKLIFGTDSDIQFMYDETTDDRLEVTDGTNLLAYFKDAGSTGNFGVTGSILANTLDNHSGASVTMYANATGINISGSTTASRTVNIGSTSSVDAHTTLGLITGKNNFISQLTFQDGGTIKYRLRHLYGTDNLRIYSDTTGADIITFSPTDIAVGSASTQTMTMTSRLLIRSVTDSGPMTATGGTQREMVFNTSDSKFYGCTVTHASAATWAALN